MIWFRQGDLPSRTVDRPHRRRPVASVLIASAALVLLDPLGARPSAAQTDVIEFVSFEDEFKSNATMGIPTDFGMLREGVLVSIDFSTPGAPFDLQSLSIGPLAQFDDRYCANIITQDTQYAATAEIQLKQPLDTPILIDWPTEYQAELANFGAVEVLSLVRSAEDCANPSRTDDVVLAPLTLTPDPKELVLRLSASDARPRVRLNDKDGGSRRLACVSKQTRYSTHTCRLPLTQALAGDYTLEVELRHDNGGRSFQNFRVSIGVL